MCCSQFPPTWNLIPIQILPAIKQRMKYVLPSHKHATQILNFLPLPYIYKSQGFIIFDISTKISMKLFASYMFIVQLDHFLLGHSYSTGR